MPLVSTKTELAELCARLARAPYFAIDTEFMRERTYWPKLCLVQVAVPFGEAVAIDPLAEGLSLDPLLEVLYAATPLKVFHAARQDLEIFYHLGGRVPGPIFDTQLAAMVSGYGEAPSYETLAARIAGARIDKSSRFTDWARRPLSERQTKYALDDVTHLRRIYERLSAELAASGRADWLAEEMATLLDPETHALRPREAWRRIRLRGRKPRMLAILREVAAVREEAAQERDIPRNRMLRDEALVEIAGHPPRDVEALKAIRGMAASLAEGRLGERLLAAVAAGLARPEADLPGVDEPIRLPSGLGATVELLKVLLKAKAEEHRVAQKLIASVSDLEQIAADDQANVPALHGWRREVFGAGALDLKHGRIGLSVNEGQIRIFARAAG